MSAAEQERKMKKIFAVILALAIAFSLCACQGASGKKERAEFLVGVCQLDQFSALDDATRGFTQALADELGDRVEIDIKNASGDVPACSTIINGLLAEGVDLIMANATPALQAAAASTSDVPILGTSVTHYAPALDIAVSDWTGTIGNNVSGTSDLADLKMQAEMITEWFPDCKNVGLLYCIGEPNSIFQVEEVSGYLKAAGLNPKMFSFTDTSDVALVTQEACEFADVIYVPTDNTAAKNTEAIANVVLSMNVPVIAGESGICKGCGIATLSIDYYDLGYATGKMAVKVLTGEADISEMPIEFAPNAKKYYNKSMCEHFNLSILPGYEEIKE